MSQAGAQASGQDFRAQRRAVRGLTALGVLGLLAAGFFLLQMPILKWSGPNAFEAIEKEHIDLDRIRGDKEAWEYYEFLKYWIMENEPTLWRTLDRTRMAGIAFALLVSATCLFLAHSLWRAYMAGAAARTASARSATNDG